MTPGGGLDPETIRITSEDLERVTVPQSYGSIPAPAAPTFTAPVSHTSVWLQGWCYLGLGGFAGALLAWSICEPWFVDAPEGRSWANWLLIPLLVMLMCTGFAVAEGIVERSARRTVSRALLSLAIGTALGFLFSSVADVIFNIALAVLAQAAHFSAKSPAFWIARSIGWVVFGVSGGLVYGLIIQSSKRTGYGILGGILGAGLGGLVFDPISLLLGGAAVSRAVGFALFGAATGVAMGLVENALKDRWLYVAAGPLAGKQFVLYKSLTTIGSSDACDLYLFKDPAVQPQHARLEWKGARLFLHADGPVTLNGSPAGHTALRSGDYLQIGRYAFHYRDRERVDQGRINR